MIGTDHYQELLASVSNLSGSRGGIRLRDRYFTEPRAFGSVPFPTFGGIYALLVNDPSWEPRPFRPIYFGEAGNLAGLVLGADEKYGEWCATAGEEDRLFVSYHLMSGSDADRAAFEVSLIREYRPVCNVLDPSEGDEQQAFE